MDWTWAQVSGPNGEVWAIPQDTGPLGMLYRKDIFAQYSIQVPTTWDEFAAAARKLHAANPKVYLTNFAASQPAAWHGLLWQAGSRPYVKSGKSTIAIHVNDASKKLAAYWGGLAKEGVVGIEPAAQGRARHSSSEPTTAEPTSGGTWSRRRPADTTGSSTWATDGVSTSKAAPPQTEPGWSSGWSAASPARNGRSSGYEVHRGSVPVPHTSPQITRQRSQRR